MNFIIAVMGDTFERVQERAHVLAILEHAALVLDVDALLPDALLRTLNARFVLLCKPASTSGGTDVAWAGFFGQLRREMCAVRGELTEQRAMLSELRAGQKELQKAMLFRAAASAVGARKG